MKHLPSFGNSKSIWKFLGVVFCALFVILLTAFTLPPASFGSSNSIALTPTPTPVSEIARLEELLRVSEARRLAAQSLLVGERDLELALLLGTEGFKRVENDETRSALFAGLQTNLQSTLRYTTTPIVSATFSDAANLVAAAGRDRQIYLSEIPGGKPFGKPLGGQAGRITALAFSPDGKTLAAGSFDHSLRVWDVNSGTLRGEPSLGHTEAVLSIAFLPDGTSFASGGADKTIRRWDTATGKSIGAPIQTDGNVRTLLASPDGKFFATRDENGSVRLWDATTGARVAEPFTDTAPALATSLAFRPDGEQLAYGLGDGSVRGWDVVNGKNSFQEVIDDAGDYVDALVYSPDGKILVAAGSNNQIYLLDARDGTPLREPLRGINARSNVLQFVRGGKLLAVWSDDSAIRFWETSRDNVWTAPLVLAARATKDAQFSPDGKWLAAAQCVEGAPGAVCVRDEIVLWNMQTRGLAVPPLEKNSPVGRAMAFSADSAVLAWSNCGKFDEQKNCAQNEIVLWDLAKAKALTPPIPLANVATAIAFHPDGKILAIAEASNAIRLWERDTGKERGAPLQGHTEGITTLVFSADGKALASASRTEARVWDMTRAKGESRTLADRTGAISGVAFSPDGKMLATAAPDKTVRVWDVNSGKPVGAPFLLDGEPVNLAFSADGKLLAVGDEASILWLWQVDSGRLLGMWDAATGNQIALWHSQLFGAMATVAFRGEGTQVWTITRDGTIRQFELAQLVQAPPARACEIVQRNLTLAEWTRYLQQGAETFEVYRKNPTCLDIAVQE